MFGNQYILIKLTSLSIPETYSSPAVFFCPFCFFFFLFPFVVRALNTNFNPFSKIFSINRLPRWLSGKESACQTGDKGLIPMSRRSPGEENDSPLHYSCLGNPMDRGTWQATYSPQGRKSLTWLSD